MELPVDLPQSLPVNMCVDLGCGNVNMAQQLLDASQVSAPAQKMRRKTVPQSVRRHVARHARPGRIFLDDSPYLYTAQGPTSSAEQQLCATSIVRQFRTQTFQIGLSAGDRHFPQRDNPLSVSFAAAPQIANREVDVGDTQTRDLSGPHASGVEQLQQGFVP